MLGVKRILERLAAGAAALARHGRRRCCTFALAGRPIRRVNLCCGAQRVPGYFGIDFGNGADLRLDLARNDLPFADNTLEAVVCMSAINYFTHTRALEIVVEVHRTLMPGGVARFGVQDMEHLARRYVERDHAYFAEKLADGSDRYPGATLGDKFAAWFYGHPIRGCPCRYFYDFESLAFLFKSAGFRVIERRGFRDSRLDAIELIDNRPEQMFFLEAVK